MISIFGNKKEEEQFEEPISNEESSPEISDDAPVVAKLARLSVDVDKLKSSNEANSELRQVNSERFSRLDEEIGELRNMIVDREKDLGELEVKATKAADLVAEVQPEALLSDVRKSDIKIESLKGKLESYHELNNTIMEELKEIRRNVKTFRGIEEVREMLKDAHKDLTTYQKIEGIVESRADKVEELYDDVSKKFEEFKTFKDSLVEMQNKFTGYQQEFEKIKTENKEVIKKSEFNDFSSKIHAFIANLEQKLHNVNVNATFINDLKSLVDSLENEIGTILNEITEIKKHIKSENVQQRLTEVEVKQKNTDSMINMLNEKYDALNKRLNGFEINLQGNDVSSFEERMLILEQSNNELSSKLDNVNDALLMVADQEDKSISYVLEKVRDYELKINAAEDREKKIIESVSRIIDIVSKLQK